MKNKLGEFWRIELVESDVTVRGKRSLHLMEVRQKMPEESKVTRDIREIRKNA
jgi:hypothetical protein